MKKWSTLPDFPRISPLNQRAQIADAQERADQPPDDACDNCGGPLSRRGHCDHCGDEADDRDRWLEGRDF